LKQHVKQPLSNGPKIQIATGPYASSQKLRKCRTFLNVHQRHAVTFCHPTRVFLCYLLKKKGYTCRTAKFSTLPTSLMKKTCFECSGTEISMTLSPPHLRRFRLISNDKSTLSRKRLHYRRCRIQEKWFSATNRFYPVCMSFGISMSIMCIYMNKSCMY